MRADDVPVCAPRLEEPDSKYEALIFDQLWHAATDCFAGGHNSQKAQSSDLFYALCPSEHARERAGRAIEEMDQPRPERLESHTTLASEVSQARKYNVQTDNHIL